MAEKEITIELKKPEFVIALLILFAIFILELQTALNSPISFGDEGYHTIIAQTMAEEKEYETWLSHRETNLSKRQFDRPPAWNALEGSFFLLFGSNELVVKILPPFIAFIIGLMTLVMIKKLYNFRTGFIAAVITVTIPAFVTYAVLLYTDALETLYFGMAFFLFLLGLKEGKKLYFLCSAVFGGLATLTKVTGYVFFVFIFFTIIYELLFKRRTTSLKKYLVMILIMILLFAPFIVRSFYYYKSPCGNIPFISNFFDDSNCDVSLFKAKYEFPTRTEQTGTEQNVLTMGLTSYLNFAYGELWFIIFAFCAGLFLLFARRNELTIFVLIMLLLYLPVFFYYSLYRAEDAARWAMPWVPLVALVASMFFDEIYKFIKTYQKYVALVIFIIVIYFSYQNFSQKLAVMAQVKQFSPSFFEACNWIKANTPKDALISTVWVYRTAYSCQRRVATSVADLVMSKNETYMLDVAKEIGINYIFIQKFSLSNDPMNERFPVDYVQFLEDHPDHFKKVFENPKGGPSLQQCLQQGGCDGNIVYEIVQ